MAELGRPKAELVLSAEERTTLEGWVRQSSTPQSWLLRCRIILACAEGTSNKDVAANLGSTEHAVGRWRARFVRYRIAGLGDMPRSGGPRTVTDEQVLDVLTKTLYRSPADATCWSTRSMARASGLSQSTVSRIWRTYGLEPHRGKASKLPIDPSPVVKGRQLVGLYLDPPERAWVFRADGRSRFTALDPTRPGPPTMPGVARRRAAGSLLDGTDSLFAVLGIATSKVPGSPHRRHRAAEFRAFLTRLDREVPLEFEVHLVCDGYVTHKSLVIRRWLLAHPRFHLHLTPSSASWRNLVERWLDDRTNSTIRQLVDRSDCELEAGVRAWIAAANSSGKPYVWIEDPDGTIAARPTSEWNI